MIEDRTQRLIDTVRKLQHRGAIHNIRKVIQKTHTADVAAMLEGFREEEAFEIFKLEPSLEKQAEVLAYLPTQRQQDIVSRLNRADAVKLLALMDTDDVADLLGNLPEDESQQFLQSMKREDSEEVADLMGYADDTAGGLMGSDFLPFRQEMTVKEAIASIQSGDEDSQVTFYLYVTNEMEQLVGVISLKQLLLSRQSELLRDIMTTSVISVKVDTPQEDVAQLVERYDFLCVPVVDDGNKLIGVITVDDVIDVIREEAEEDLLAMGQAGFDVEATTKEHFWARLPWLTLSFAGGAICFTMIYFFGYFQSVYEAPLASLWIVAAFIPVMLATGTVAGTQASTIIVAAIRAGSVDRRKLLDQLKKEILLALMFSVFFGGLVLVLGLWIFPEYHLTMPFSGAMTLQILISVFFGIGVPMGLLKLGMNPSVAPIPLFTTLADISAIAVLFGLYYAG